MQYQTCASRLTVMPVTSHRDSICLSRRAVAPHVLGLAPGRMVLPRRVSISCSPLAGSDVQGF